MTAYRSLSVGMLVGIAVGLAMVAGAVSPPRVDALARCGVERWGVKTLSDPATNQVSFAPRAITVDFLRARPDPHTRRAWGASAW